MGTDPITAASDGTVIPAADHNSLRSAFLEDLVPRNTSGIATTLAGDLGTSSLEFLKAHIASGYFFAGQILPMHTYNGVATPGHGWMLCDGRIINETNYDAEFSSTDWDTYIISSILDGKYLPNLTGNKYLSGKSATAQTGASPITEVGLASNQQSVPNHTHTINAHKHKWYEANDVNTTDQSWDTGGSLTNITQNSKAALKLGIEAHGGSSNSPQDLWTENTSTGPTGSDGAETFSIQPRSVEVVYYMRII